MANGPVYEFGPYRLEPAEHRVACGGQVIPLPPKAFDVLVFLVERSGHLVSKQELLDHIWGDVQVEEGNLTLNVSIIRRALGSAAPGQHFLETVPKRGYRFTPGVTRVNDGQDPSAAAVGSAHTKPFGERSGMEQSIRVNTFLPAIIALAVGLAVIALLSDRLFLDAIHGYSVQSSARTFETIDINDFQTQGCEALGPDPGTRLSDEIASRLDTGPVKRWRITQNHGRATRFQLLHNAGSALLHGTVRCGSDRISVVYRITTGSNVDLWSDHGTYMSVPDASDADNEISKFVAYRSGMCVSEHPETHLCSKTTDNINAFLSVIEGIQDLDAGPPSRTKLATARQLFERAVRFDPRYGHAYAVLALATFRIPDLPERRLSQALEYAHSAVNLDPTDGTARKAIISIYSAVGQNEEALREGRLALKNAPHDPDAVEAAAHAYFRAGLLDPAIDLYRQVVSMDASRWDARGQLARSLLYAGRYEEGLRAVSGAPPRSRAEQMWEMMLRLEIGETVRAQQLARQLVRDYPDEAVAAYFAGSALFASGHEVEANELWRSAALRFQGQISDPSSEDTQTFLSLIYARLGKRQDACKVMNHLLAQHRGEGWFLYFASKMYAILGDNDEAIKQLRAALEHGFMALHFVDYHQHPSMGLFALRTDPRFRQLRDELARKVEALRTQYHPR